MSCRTLLFLGLLAGAYLLVSAPNAIDARPRRSKTSTRRHPKRPASKPKHRQTLERKRSKKKTRSVEVDLFRGMPYRVQKGDTLGRLAKRFKVTIAQLQQWNGIKGSQIRIGQILRIKTKGPGRGYRLVKYRVERGDRLRDIARRYRITLNHLRNMNRPALRRVKWRLREGMTLSFYKKGPLKLSESVGLPHRGHLVNGEKLPKLRGVYLKNGTQWGTNETIEAIIDAVWRFHRQAKRLRRRSPLIVIGDLSKKNGGRYSGHRSHQSGRDIDVGYISKKDPMLKRFKGMSCRTMDVPLTWALINSFLSAGRVERIFVHYPLQRCFYDYLVDKGVSKSTLARIIQYPRGPGSQRGILRHFRNHHHHFHVRYFCSSRDKQCRDNGETPRLVSVDVSRRPDHHRRHRRRAN